MISDKQKHILRHSLGLSKGDREYRNHFVTGPGSKDYEDCIDLVNKGYMVWYEGSELSGGGDIFSVLEAGKKVARDE